MESLPELMENFDFFHGLKFQKEINQLFRSSVHHPSSSPAGSFFLLVTFRRFTFHLTEESVALALQSCIGGSGPGFHVTYLKDRHLWVSVASKVVGFHVYKNHTRFIGWSFDVYFHMWNN